MVSTIRVDQVSRPFLQRLAAGSLGKSLAVQVSPNGALARLLSDYGIDPALCGFVAGHDTDCETTNKRGT